MKNNFSAGDWRRPKHRRFNLWFASAIVAVLIMAGLSANFRQSILSRTFVSITGSARLAATVCAKYDRLRYEQICCNGSNYTSRFNACINCFGADKAAIVTDGTCPMPSRLPRPTRNYAQMPSQLPMPSRLPATSFAPRTAGYCARYNGVFDREPSCCGGITYANTYEACMSSPLFNQGGCVRGACGAAYNVPSPTPDACQRLQAKSYMYEPVCCGARTYSNPYFACKQCVNFAQGAYFNGICYKP